MKTKLISQISQVNVSTSIFPPGGHNQKGFDMYLMDETMLILSCEEGKTHDWSGPNHCNPYITLAYDSWSAANDRAIEDSHRVASRARELYENCAVRKILVEAYAVLYNELDQRVCDIENKKILGLPGECERINDEMARLQGLMYAHAPYDYGDKRDLGEVLVSVNAVRERLTEMGLDFRQEIS